MNGTEQRDVVRLARSGDDAVLVSPPVEVLITPVIDLGAGE